MELPGIGEWPSSSWTSGCPEEEAPDIIFLSETKHDRKWMEWFRWKLEKPNMVAKSSNGTSGGLALFWRRDTDVTVKSMSKYHIDVVIKED